MRLTDEAISEVYALAREAFASGQRGFQFQSYPFRMTAENLAKHLFWHVCPELLRETGIIVNKVVFWETPNCRAEESLPLEDEKLSALYNVYGR